MDLALLGRLLMALTLAWFEHAQIIGQFFWVVQCQVWRGVKSLCWQIQTLPTHQQGQSAQTAPGGTRRLPFDLGINTLCIH